MSAEPAEQPVADSPATPVKPTLRERFRPLELLGISLILAVFSGFVTAFTIRPWAEDSGNPAQDWLLVLVVFGATFVLTLVTLAMLALGGYEPPKEAPSEVLVRPQDKLPRSGWKDQKPPVEEPKGPSGPAGE